MTHTSSPISAYVQAAQRDQGAWEKPFLRVGHGGASGHAPANSLRSIKLALELGVDMVEFDLRPCRDALVLVHDDSLEHYGQPGGLVSQSTLPELQALSDESDLRIARFEEALQLIKGKALVNIDLKAEGYEEPVVERVRSLGMSGEVMYSSLIPSSLARLRQLEPVAFTAISFPEDKGNASAHAYLKPVVELALTWMRLTLPGRILQMMSTAQANSAMLYHRVISPQLIETVQAAGGRLFAWTVDDPGRMQELREMGVNGVTTNYPDLLRKTLNHEGLEEKN